MAAVFSSKNAQRGSVWLVSHHQPPGAAAYNREAHVGQQGEILKGVGRLRPLPALSILDVNLDRPKWSSSLWERAMLITLTVLGILAGASSAPTGQAASAPARAQERVISGPGFHCRSGEWTGECDIELSFLGGGYFQIIDDPAYIAEITEAMELSLEGLGIPAHIGVCDWMGLVASGTASGSRAYGARCAVTIGQQPSRWLMICSERYGGITLVGPSDYAADPHSIELFIRRACF